MLVGQEPPGVQATKPATAELFGQVSRSIDQHTIMRVKRWPLAILAAVAIGIAGILVGVDLGHGSTTTPTPTAVKVYGYIQITGTIPTVQLPPDYPCGTSAIDQFSCSLVYSQAALMPAQAQQICDDTARGFSSQGPTVYGPDGTLLGVGTVSTANVAWAKGTGDLVCGVPWQASVPDEPVYTVKYGKASSAVNRADVGTQINFSA